MQDGKGAMRRRSSSEGKKRGEEKETLKVIFWNVAGIKNKDEEFWQFIRSFEVVSLAETWIEKKEWEKLKGKMPSEFNWECQPAKRDNKKGRAKGGIISGVKKGIKEEVVNQEEVEGIKERRIIIEGR